MVTLVEPTSSNAPLTVSRVRHLFDRLNKDELAKAFRTVTAHGDAAVPILRTLLGDEQRHVVLHAAQALALLGDDEMLRYVAVEFEDMPGVVDWLVGLGVRGMLGLLMSRETYDPTGMVVDVLTPHLAVLEPELLRIIGSGGEFPLCLVKLLGHSKTRVAYETLVALVDDRTRIDGVRWVAAEAIANGGHVEAIELLGSHLLDENEDAELRESCGHGLERLGGARAAEFLKRGEKFLREHAEKVAEEGRRFLAQS